MAPNLDSLPPELLNEIAELCLAEENEDEDYNYILFRLRSTCRAVEAGVRHAWRTAYFSHRYVSFDVEKLEQLKAVAAIPDLAEAITIVEVQCIEDAKLLSTLHNGDGPISALSELLQPFERTMRCAFQSLTKLAIVCFSTIETDINDPWYATKKDVIDVSASFVTVLKAVQDCNLRPTSILARAAGDVMFEIGNSSVMSQFQECFSEVKELELSFLFDSSLLNRPIDPTQLGQHFAAGLNQFRSLTRLQLGSSGVRP